MNLRMPANWPERSLPDPLPVPVARLACPMRAAWPVRPPRAARLARASALALAAALLAGPAPGTAAELAGRVTLLAKNGKGPARGADPRLAVVYFEPAGAPRTGSQESSSAGTPQTSSRATSSQGAGTSYGSQGAGTSYGSPAAHAPRAPKEPDTPFQLLTKNKEFIPHLLVVPVGSRVQFPNQDPILHNVFSVSPGNAFDLGIYRVGPPKEKRFEQAGLVRVYCNVHQAMAAYILVLDTPFHVSPAADGSFRLTGLPKGPGKLNVWHEQADPWSVELTLPQAEDAPPVQARLVVVRPKLPPHLNKTGGAYASGDSYR
jgi:plastocyanin